LIGTAAPVGWWTWLSKMPDDAERGGGLMVAVIQLAITLGATVGGFFYGASGYQSTFGISAAILLCLCTHGVRRNACRCPTLSRARGATYMKNIHHRIRTARTNLRPIRELFGSGTALRSRRAHVTKR
jgi:MFS family permease